MSIHILLFFFQKEASQLTVTKFLPMIVMNMVIPKAVSKHDLSFNKFTSQKFLPCLDFMEILIKVFTLVKDVK